MPDNKFTILQSEALERGRARQTLRARRALSAYPGDLSGQMVQLLSDIRHACDAKGIAYNEIDSRAHMRYQGELADINEAIKARAAAEYARGE